MYMRGEPRRIAGLLLHDQMRCLLFLRVFCVLSQEQLCLTDIVPCYNIFA